MRTSMRPMRITARRVADRAGQLYRYSALRLSDA